MRFSLAGMWYLGTLWKLPLPVSDGFKYWLEQTVKFSSFQVHADLMQVFLNHIALVQPLVYLLEIGFTHGLMLAYWCDLPVSSRRCSRWNLLVGSTTIRRMALDLHDHLASIGMFAAIGAGAAWGSIT